MPESNQRIERLLAETSKAIRNLEELQQYLNDGLLQWDEEEIEASVLDEINCKILNLQLKLNDVTDRRTLHGK